MVEKSIIEVRPACMFESREPKLIEKAYGVPEKDTTPVSLPYTFKIKEGALLYTYKNLPAIVYTYDVERG